jgi:hypothetical protein
MSSGYRTAAPGPWETDERDLHLDDASPVIGRRAAQPEATSTGGHLLGLVAGDEVVHERWGLGRVLSVTGAGDRATAQVRFGGGIGDKTLMLSMAPLSRP